MNPAEFDRCTVSELRRHPSACIARAGEIGRPLFITRRGTVVAVLTTLEQHELMQKEAKELALFVQHSTTSTFGRADADERAAGVGALRGSLKDSDLDEDDYRRYLEEKYL